MELNYEKPKKEMEEDEGFNNLKELLMYYQTSTRNVALTTAVSFAALGYSRYYRGKSYMYTTGLALVSFLIISCSALLNYYLYNSLQKYLSQPKYSKLNKWIIINKVFFIVHSILILFALYTVFRLLTGTTF